MKKLLGKISILFDSLIPLFKSSILETELLAQGALLAKQQRLIDSNELNEESAKWFGKVAEFGVNLASYHLERLTLRCKAIEGGKSRRRPI